jgi:methylation protein EvaC
LNNLLKRNGLTLFRVDNLSVHGGSNRIYAVKGNVEVEQSVEDNLTEESIFGINHFQTYEIFAKRVKNSKEELLRCLKNLKHNGKKIISIGATAKSTTVFNYCKIDTELIDVITDTTAWNFKDVIANKEREFVENGGKFITHVPQVMVFS